MASNPRMLATSWTSAGARSHLLYTIYTSLTRESPPLHITLRSNDQAGNAIGSFAHEIGDGEYGTTVVNERRSPECSCLYDDQGRMVSIRRNDDLFRQAGDDFVQKHQHVIEVRAEDPQEHDYL